MFTNFSRSVASKAPKYWSQELDWDSICSTKILCQLFALTHGIKVKAKSPNIFNFHSTKDKITCLYPCNTCTISDESSLLRISCITIRTNDIKKTTYQLFRLYVSNKEKEKKHINNYVKRIALLYCQKRRKACNLQIYYIQCHHIKDQQCQSTYMPATNSFTHWYKRVYSTTWVQPHLKPTPHNQLVNAFLKFQTHLDKCLSAFTIFYVGTT